ncbi:head-tail adaptor protein [Mammaliicoccus sciuri]|uniref:phage head closure protein n=1 Tax=Mammaliicoccus sciuri TaxID=1296 RepID=UPI000E677B02|nr:phage head closure protein [Mammaliicoccus sciuri]RIO10104.1 head-tail adaptor protein [Mammaliicoccus sciuri]
MAYHFNNRIEILGIKTVKDDEGGYSKVEQTIAKPWADIKTMRASEFESMGFNATKTPIRFIIRYRKGVELDHKIKYAGDVYEIESIANDDGKNQTLTIFANKKEL